MAGGVIGKGMFAFFLTSLFTQKRTIGGIGRGIGRFFRMFALKNPLSAGLFLMGCGFALAAYNFMTGNNAPHNAMAGIAAFLLTLRAALPQRRVFCGALPFL
jgi:hypothetical protein